MILLLIMLLLAGGTICTVAKIGEKDGLANYNYIGEEEEN